MRFVVSSGYIGSAERSSVSANGATCDRKCRGPFVLTGLCQFPVFHSTTACGRALPLAAVGLVGHLLVFWHENGFDTVGSTVTW